LTIRVSGAGAAGSSAAYHLSKYAQLDNVPLSIDVFEKNNFVGGRSTTVYAYGGSLQPVELGASIFVKVNHILVDAVNDFNLSTSSLKREELNGSPALGVWDGAEFRLIQKSDAFGWFDLAKLFWRFGLAPVRTVNLMKATVGAFLKMYESPVFPFESLTAASETVGLLPAIASTGEEFMLANGIQGDFGRDVVQASTRVNYAQNLAHIHGLEAMVCMATEGAMAVEGGNWRIFDNMLASSEAKLQLSSTVRSIRRLTDGTYLIKADSDGQDPQSKLYDAVVLAAPYQFSDIELFNVSKRIDKIPYVELHVTIFTSPYRLSPAFFNLESEALVPKVVLTTLPKNEPPRRGRASVGSPGFFSISLLDATVNPDTRAPEYLYKIFSPEVITEKYLATLLHFQGQSANPGIHANASQHVTWIYRKVWNSYPYEYPRVTFEEIEIASNLYYTGGMDSFISTMETNALMGKNVARLLINKWNKPEARTSAAAKIDL
jgi:prenylcysteine oxidase/farnesylcysteine lyase